MPSRTFLGIRRKSSFENFNDSLNKHIDENRERINMLASTLSRLPTILGGRIETASQGAHSDNNNTTTTTSAAHGQESGKAALPSSTNDNTAYQTSTGVADTSGNSSSNTTTTTSTVSAPSTQTNAAPQAQQSPKIAIIGAGPGGLALANILARNGVQCNIFELSETSRSQGGTLDVHPEFGQAALKEAGLWQEFTQYARPEADVMKIVNPSGEVLWDGNGPDKQDVAEGQEFDHRPEIDRARLMEILQVRLPKDVIRWSHKLQRVQPVYTNPISYDLHFADGSVEPGFSLVVGADGAWSKVRPLLTDERPSYSGVSGVEFWLHDADHANPWVSQFVGAGSMFSFDDGRAVLSQRLGDGVVRTYAMAHLPEDFIPRLAREQHGIDFAAGRPAEARDRFIDLFFADLHPDLRRLLRESTDDVVPRALYHLPVGHSWQHPAGSEAVTLLGDAAHLMTPFAGVGVNAALADSLSLGKIIVESVKAGAVGAGDSGSMMQQQCSMTDVVAKYEKDLFPRGEKFAAKTMQGLKGHFTAAGNEHFAAKFIDHYYGGKRP